MKRLLCQLGFHDWEYEMVVTIDSLDRWKQKRTCLRCGKVWEKWRKMVREDDDEEI